MKKFSERLRELRGERGLSLAQLAKETKFSQSALSYWEIGKRIPNAVAIITLARFFSVSTDYLLGVEDYSASKVIPLLRLLRVVYIHEQFR